MKIMVNLENTDNYQEIDINENSTIIELKQQLQFLFNIQFNKIQISLNGQTINDDSLTINNLGINDSVLVIKEIKSPFNTITNSTNNQNNLGDIFSNYMSNRRNNIPQQQQNLGDLFSSIMTGIRTGNILNNFNQQNYAKELYIQNAVKETKEKYLTNKRDLDALFKKNPQLAEAIKNGNDKVVEDYIRNRMKEIEKEEMKRKMEYMNLLASDPNDPNVQKKIEEIIKQKNINENLKYAEEYLPETLFAVHMLFIHLEINKKRIIALVDTGAQSTIMSKELVEKCNLMNLVDTRYSGIAQGVGTSKIIGTIHAAQLKIQDKFLMCKITVIENPTIGFIFGLDNMRTYRCNIDLGKNALIFPDANIKAQFLSDGEFAKIREEEEN
jgi:DNA damage-inducible protein 1